MGNFITDNIDIWTSAIVSKKSVGRGSSKKKEAYGIKKLRELILELAVRGKLVPQDESDESATVLFEKIVKEREQLVKDKKIKKYTKLKNIEENEKSFTLPSNWKWVRLQEIIHISSGDGLTASNMNKNGKIPVFGGNGITGYHDENNIDKSTLVIGRVGYYCGSVHITPISAWITDNAFKTTFSEKNIDINFLYWLLKGTNLKENENATAQPVISGKKIYPIVVALPPLNEQKRIVKKVDELMLLCDKLEEEQEKNSETHQILVETLLDTLTNVKTNEEFSKAWQDIAEQFEILFTTEKSIDKLEESILQLAVMGKLVAQDETDEPATVLLDRIVEEKERLIAEGIVKKQKPLPEISEDEKLFELPNGWEWSRLNNVIDVRDGTHDSPKISNDKDSFPLVTSKDFKNGEIDFDSARRISAKDHYKISKRSFVEVDDILFSMIGGNLGNQVIVRDERPFSIKNIALFKYYDKSLTLPYFIKKYFENVAYTLQSFASGGAQPFISLGALRKLIIAVPPVEEQERIVKKVDELMALCDSLRLNLREMQRTEVNLADSVAEMLVG